MYIFFQGTRKQTEITPLCVTVLVMYLFCIVRDQPAEWRCGVCARPVEVQPRERAGLPAPPGWRHHSHHRLT